MELKKSQISKLCDIHNYKLNSFKILGLGAHNINYLLNTNKGKFVLRVENNDQFDNLEKEYIFLKESNGKLGPKVYYFDDSKKVINKKYLIEEFIEGVHPDENISIIFLKQMGNWFRKLHNNKSIESIYDDKNNKFDLELFFEKKYYHSFKKYENILETNLKFNLNHLDLEALKIIRDNKKVFSKIKYLSLNHSDPSPSNCFIEKNNNLRLIDWEFVKYDLPEFDLAFFIWSYQLNNKQKEIFLSAYCYPKTKYFENKFNIINLIMHFSFLDWLFQRLDLSIKGELKPQKGIYCSSKKEILERIDQYCSSIKELLIGF